MLVHSAWAQPTAAILPDITISASATTAWVENLSRTSNPLDAKDGSLYEANVVASSSRELSRNWLLQASVDLGAHVTPAFERTTLFTLGAHGSAQRKFGLGPMAPVLRFEVAYTYTEARINENDGGTLSGGVTVSKRFLPNLRAGATASWLDHYAKQAAYDIQQRTVSIDAAWDFLENWELSASAGRLSGRIVANAAPATWNKATTGGLGPTIFNYYNSIPFATTNAYGAGWVAYNVEAEVDLWSVALTHAFTDATSLDLRLSSAYVTNAVDVRYLTKTWAVGLARRF